LRGCAGGISNIDGKDVAVKGRYQLKNKKKQ
jgi:hypothetical protein